MYIVYKIINKLNNCIYVGVHKTDNLNDGYKMIGNAVNVEFSKILATSIKDALQATEKAKILHAS